MSPGSTGPCRPWRRARRSRWSRRCRSSGSPPSGRPPHPADLGRARSRRAPPAVRRVGRSGQASFVVRLARARGSKRSTRLAREAACKVGRAEGVPVLDVQDHLAAGRSAAHRPDGRRLRSRRSASPRCSSPGGSASSHAWRRSGEAVRAPADQPVASGSFTTGLRRTWTPSSTTESSSRRRSWYGTSCSGCPSSSTRSTATNARRGSVSSGSGSSSVSPSAAIVSAQAPRSVADERLAVQTPSTRPRRRRSRLQTSALGLSPSSSAPARRFVGDHPAVSKARDEPLAGPERLEQPLDAVHLGVGADGGDR